MNYKMIVCHVNLIPLNNALNSIQAAVSVEIKYLLRRKPAALRKNCAELAPRNSVLIQMLCIRKKTSTTY